MSKPEVSEKIDVTPRLRGQKETIEKVLTKLRRIRPQSNAAGTFEVCRSTKEILSRVKYITPTGIKAWDDITGGMPWGRITELYGPEGCGKTAIAIRTCVQAQIGEIYQVAKDGSRTKVQNPEVTILFIDNEQSLDEGERVSVDGHIMDAIVERCDTVDLLFKTMDTTIDVLNEVQEQTKVEQFLVVVVDTIAGTASKEEITREWGKDDFPRQAKQLREGFRVLIRKIQKHNVLMICTNQVGASFKPTAGGGRSMLPQESDFTTPGGKAVKYYSRLRVFMFATDSKYRLYPTSKYPDGLIIQFFTKKCMLRKPLRSGRMVLLFGSVESQGQIFHSGFNDKLSWLEHLAFLRFIGQGAKGDYTVDFAKHGIGTNQSASLQDQDDGAGPGEKIVITRRIDWPMILEKHQYEFEQLWQKSLDHCFKTEGLAVVDGDPDEDDDDLSEVDL